MIIFQEVHVVCIGLSGGLLRCKLWRNVINLQHLFNPMPFDADTFIKVVFVLTGCQSENQILLRK